ncbi:MAG: ABC transporter ATP-binding protein [Christensenellales bacterium]|nr:MAG: ABC transporter [Oscillospiraceae bacterium]
MIEVKHLTKKYGSGVAVSDLSFKVESGKIYGFLGPNGAGKSTTMNIIAGCLAPTEGQVLIGGYDICEEPDEAKRLIGYLPEQPPLYPDMTPEEYLTFVGRAKGLRGAELHEEIEYVMDATCIGGMRNRLIKNLSKGYKQRVGIAQAMLGSPEIIILDEPTVGLDPRQIIYIRSLIKKLGERHTVILSSHILSEISAVCDYVMIISHGKLVASSPIDDLGSALGEEKATEITVRGSVTQLSALLESIDALDGYEIDPTDEDGVLNARLTTEDEGALREQLFTVLAGAGMTVYRIQPVTRTLEEMFLRLTQEDDAASVDEDMPDDESIEGDDGDGDGTADAYGDDVETDGETDSGTDADSGAADVDTDTNGVHGTDAAGDTDGDDGYKPLFG